MTKIKVGLSVLSIILPIMALPGCSWNEAREELIIAEASQPVFALLYIAEAQDYFADEGLDVTFKSFTSGKDALNSVINGESDISTVFETPIVHQSFRGEKLSIITTLHNSELNTALVARKDHGIAVAADLKGKTIAVSKGTNGEFFLFMFLASHGIKLSEVAIVDTEPLNMTKVLSEGTVDAIATWNPHVYNAQRSLGQDDVVTMFADVYTEISVLAGMREVVSQREEAMERLLKAIIRAERFLQESPEESIKIVVERLPDLPEPTIRGVWNSFDAEAKLDNVLLTVLEREGQWLRDRGIVEGPIPNFRETLFTEYLKNVRAGSVTVN